MILCHDARQSPEELLAIRHELGEAGIALPGLVAATRYDETSVPDLARLRSAVPDLEVIPVSILDDDSMTVLRAGILRLSGLIRVYLRKDGHDDKVPMCFRPPVTVVEVANAIHHEVGRLCRGARICGPSARFPGQRFGSRSRAARRRPRGSH
jgi:ribosome-interacting GTPase 1